MDIHLRLRGKSFISLSYVIDGELFFSSLQILPEENFHVYAYCWLIAESKSIFLKMPFEQITLHISKKVFDISKDAINAYGHTINNTNKFVRKLFCKNFDSSAPDSILFFKVNDQRYNNLFSYLNRDNHKPIHTLYEPTNFDSISRRFTIKPCVHNVEKVVDFIISKNISKVVVVNLEPLVTYLFKEHINIFTVLYRLGISLTNIQNDPAELTAHGYLLRKISNYGSTEYLVHSVLSCSFDERISTAVFPSPIMQNYSCPHEESTVPLMENYDIYVTSNSRFGPTMNYYDAFMPVINQLENPLIELPLWYLSISNLLDQEGSYAACVLDQKRKYYHHIFYCAAQYLKYEIIKNISPDINIAVYGDKGWEKICPNRYKGFLDLNELEKAYHSNNILVLLMNYGYTYLDHSGPIYDVIRAGTNWINVPSVVTTAPLEGLRHLEYSSYSELNSLLKNYRSIAHQAEPSKKILRSLYQSSTNHLKDHLFDKKIASSFEFTSSHSEHTKLLKQKISEFTAGNFDFLLDQIYN